MFGISLAEKSAMREIHVHGELAPAHYVSTCFGAARADTAAEDEGPKSYVAHRCGAGFDVVRTPQMVTVEGPFITQQEAEDAASILRMERKAERIDSRAIKEMAMRAEIYEQDPSLSD